MTNAEAIETLKAIRDNLDPRFAHWSSELRKSESLSMAIALLEGVEENAKRDTISTQ